MRYCIDTMLQVSSSSSTLVQHLSASPTVQPLQALAKIPMQRRCGRRKPADGLLTRLRMARCAPAGL